MDVYDSKTRSSVMRAVRGRDTQPELVIRRLLHASGYRYRLHRKDLPGSPDIVFVGRRKVIFVHGCFWHRHVGCRRASMPASNIDFWHRKFERNVARDAKARRSLQEMGWDSLVVWECETRDKQRLLMVLRSFLDNGRPETD